MDKRAKLSLLQKTNLEETILNTSQKVKKAYQLYETYKSKLSKEMIFNNIYQEFQIEITILKFACIEYQIFLDKLLKEQEMIKKADILVSRFTN